MGEVRETGTGPGRQGLGVGFLTREEVGIIVSYRGRALPAEQA